MIKTITIEDKEYKMRADAFFPIFYRRELGRDAFSDSQMFQNNPFEVISYFTYGMIKYADASQLEGFSSAEEWLATLPMFAVSMVADDITELMALDKLTTSTSKKKKGK